MQIRNIKLRKGSTHPNGNEDSHVDLGLAVWHIPRNSDRKVLKRAPRSYLPKFWVEWPLIEDAITEGLTRWEAA